MRGEPPARDHRALGKPLTPATMQRIRATLRTALNAGLRQGLISDNPAARIELPGARRPQAAVFLHGIRDHRLYAAYHLIALRGLRRGEAAGLRWCDLDLDGGVAFICQQLQQYDGHLTVCPPKTRKSARVIALDHTTIAALRAHKERQRQERLRFGKGYSDSGY